MISLSLPHPFPDFLVFHAATWAWSAGKTDLIYSVGGLTNLQNVLYADTLTRPLLFRPFLYPPTWLVLVLPFGALAFAQASALFMAATVVTATLLVGRHDRWGWLAILASPAAAWTVLAGQNSFLTLGLFWGGLRLVERAPVAAGLLLGLLSYKPQVWLLVPVALLAARQWRALGWTVVTAGGLVLLSAAVLGPDLWLGYLEAMREAGSPGIVDRMFKGVFRQMTTPWAMARILGLPPGPSGMLQLVASLLAGVAVWIAYRRFPPGEARIAVLATATLLASPYGLNYELLLLMPAVVSLFRRGAAHGFLRGEWSLHAILWLLPYLIVMLNDLGLPLAPAALLLFGASAWARLGNPAKVEWTARARAG